MKPSETNSLFWHHQLIAPAYTVLAPYALDAAILDIGAGYVPGLTMLVQQGASQLTCIHQHTQRLQQDCQQQGLDGVDILPWPLSNNTLPEQTYDLILINGTSLKPGEDWSQLLEQARLALASNGILLWSASPPQAGLSLAALASATPQDKPSEHHWQAWHTQLNDHFASVQWLGQLPLMGHLLYDCAELSHGDALKLDRELLPEVEEQPSHLLALCSQEPLALAEMAVIQLPFAELLHQLPPQSSSTEHSRHGAALEQAQQQVRLLQAEIEVLKQQLAESEQTVTHMPAAKTPATKPAEALAMPRSSTQQVLQVLQQEAKEEDSQIRAALPDSADAMIQLLPQHGAKSTVAPSTSMPSRDVMGRKLDSAVDELEDLLRDVSAPRGHK